jgi:hypothetical protein
MTRAAWHARTQRLNDGGDRRIAVAWNQRSVSFGAVMGCWQRDPAFREFFIELLAGIPLDAFRWETPPLTRENRDRPFEFVLLDAPELKRPADPSDFAEHFRDAASGDVIEFSNLGADALMLVPTPGEPRSAYAHLAAFVRGAPAEQQHRLWRRVGAALDRRLGDRPVWLSTAGAGVPWLHLRLDDRPKYYGYSPWRKPP